MPKFVIFSSVFALLVFLGAFLRLEALPGSQAAFALAVVFLAVAIYFLVRSRRRAGKEHSTSG